jgi:AcrR family transcriptional regulator
VASEKAMKREILLPRGPHALPRGRVAAVQRERIIGSFTNVCARRGNGRASVAEIVAEAGVSRATFYEHFDNRDDCFLAAYRQAAAGLREAVGAAWRGVPAERGLGNAVIALLDWAMAEPEAARLVLVEALGGSPAVRAEREELARDLATELHQLAERDGAGPLQIPPAALFGGITWTVAVRLMRGQDPGSDTGAILAWLRSHALPSRFGWLSAEEWESLRLPASAPAVAERAPPEGLRERVIFAIARLSRERGYAAMTVADLVREAPISREAFYECFSGKQEAFEAAQEYGLQDAAAHAAAAFVVGDTWPERIWNGLNAMLRYTASQFDLAAVDLVESYAVGPQAIERSMDNRLAFTLFLEEGYRQSEKAACLPRLCSEAVSGAVLELIRKEVVADRTTELSRQSPSIAYVALAPFLGSSTARAFVT